MKEIYTFDSREVKIKEYPKRYASRAVIFNDNKILLLYLNKTKEYKFPGGGVEPGELYTDAVVREAKEEAGVEITNIESCLGYIDQVYPDMYDNSKTYYMRSFYYLCSISDKIHKQELSDREMKLEFTPKWVSLEEAIDSNELRLKNGSDYHWTKRELFMLKYLRDIRKD